jgi:hypothetical protein
LSVKLSVAVEGSSARKIPLKLGIFPILPDGPTIAKIAMFLMALKKIKGNGVYQKILEKHGVVLT